MSSKNNKTDLVYFGGNNPMFETPRSIANLVKPNINNFYSYTKQSFEAGHLTDSGVVVQLFEERLKKIYGVKHAIAMCNGGITLAVKFLALEGRREVIMPSLGYRRMADVVAWMNLTPHFCDVHPETMGITAAAAKKCINENTALILAPQPIVNICDIDGLVELSEETGIPLFFDSVEAGYCSHKGRMIGSFGDGEYFSMHASKFLNGFEGSYVTTNNDALAENLRLARNSGINADGGIECFGMRAHLNEVHAAMAMASFDDMPHQIERNKQHYYQYKKLLSEIKGLELVEYDESEKRTFKNIMVGINDRWRFSRDETLEILIAEKMLARAYYSPPLHKRPTNYTTIVGDVEHSSRLAEKYMLLPSGYRTSAEDIEKICDVLKLIQNIKE